MYTYREFTTENLRFLNVDQALADIAYFILELKKQERFANSKIILYGGSYAANMALWFKQRYPHLVEGAVASSGPIKGKVDFAGKFFTLFVKLIKWNVIYHTNDLENLKGIP